MSVDVYRIRFDPTLGILVRDRKRPIWKASPCVGNPNGIQMPMPGELDPKDHPELYIDDLEKNSLELQRRCFALAEQRNREKRLQIAFFCLGIAAGLAVGLALLAMK